jgi:hypothetical protein
VEGLGEDLGVLSKIVCVNLRLGVEGFCMINLNLGPLGKFTSD